MPQWLHENVSKTIEISSLLVTSQRKWSCDPLFSKPHVLLFTKFCSETHLQPGLHIFPQFFLVHRKVVLGQPVGVQDGSHQSSVTINVGEVLQDIQRLPYCITFLWIQIKCQCVFQAEVFLMSVTPLTLRAMASTLSLVHLRSSSVTRRSWKSRSASWAHSLTSPSTSKVSKGLPQTLTLPLQEFWNLSKFQSLCWHLKKYEVKFCF